MQPCIGGTFSQSLTSYCCSSTTSIRPSLALKLSSSSTMSSGFLASTSTISTLLLLCGHMMFPRSRKCHKKSLSTHCSRLTWSREDPNLNKMSAVLKLQIQTILRLSLKKSAATMQLANFRIAHLTNLVGREKEAEKEKVLLDRRKQKQEIMSRKVFLRPTSTIYSNGHQRQLSLLCQTEEQFSLRKNSF